MLERSPLHYLSGTWIVHAFVGWKNADAEEPLEDYGLTEQSFQKLLLQYEEDEEVMAIAQQLLHPAGDPGACPSERHR